MTRDPEALAAEALAAAYPLLVAGRAPVNRLFHGPGPPDTQRLSGWLDLGPEPVVLETPDTHGRYYALTFRDAWNVAIASVGARTTGTKAQAFAILGPRCHGEHLPAGLRPIPAPTRLVRVTGCLEAHSTREHALPLAGFRVSPLSGWRRGAGTPPAREADPPPPLDPESCVADLLGLLADNPPRPAERDLADRVLAAGSDAATREAFERGARRGLDTIEQARRDPQPVAGWRVVDDHDHTRTDALRVVADADADGAPLTGRHAYVLRFAAGEHPPANAFWSLTAAATSAPADRGPRCIGDLRGLALDLDGSLPIHIQRARPPRAREANWLPAPADAFRLTLRLHWPREDALAGGWSPPAVERRGAPSGADPAR